MCQSSVTCNFGATTIIIDDKPHRCKHCEKRFAKISSLRLHLNDHFGIKQFLCNICKKEFRKGGNYKAHIDSHAGIRPFVCKICTRRYLKNQYAKRHVKNHLFERPYKCSHCTKSYIRIQDLNRHVRIEHKFKTSKSYNIRDRLSLPYCRRFYLCKICRKQFSSISIRNTHQCNNISDLVVSKISVQKMLFRVIKT